MKQIIKDIFWAWLRVIAGVAGAAFATGGAVLCFNAFFFEAFTVRSVVEHAGILLLGTALVLLGMIAGAFAIEG